MNLIEQNSQDICNLNLSYTDRIHALLGILRVKNYVKKNSRAAKDLKESKPLGKLRSEV